MKLINNLTIRKCFPNNLTYVVVKITNHKTKFESLTMTNQQRLETDNKLSLTKILAILVLIKHVKYARILCTIFHIINVINTLTDFIHKTRISFLWKTNLMKVVVLNLIYKNNL